MDETARLESIANNSIYAYGVNALTIKYSGSVFLRHMVNGSVLELGPAEGLMTDILYPRFGQDYTATDGSSAFTEQLKARYPRITACTALFEEFKPNRRYDNIILGHVLEHVIDPVAILKLCRQWLEKSGVILAAVPNANSLHRQAAVAMGLLNKLDDFSEQDRQNGHRRVFFRDDFARCFIEAGFEIIEHGGYFLKPLSNAQIEKDWNKQLTDTYMALGEKYPEIAGEMYIIAR